MAIVWFQIRYGLRPLKKVSESLAKIRSGDAERLQGDFPKEVAPLAGEVNALLESNREIVDRARTHVGNLAHALKTPLSVLVNETSNVQGPLGDKVREQLGVMRDQVQRHLERARIAARVAVVSSTIDVAPVVEVLVRTMEKIHRDRGIALQSKTNPEIRFRGERQDIEEMVGNLVDNACKWAATKVNIEMFALRAPLAGRPASFRIQVDDDGPGLAPAEREEVLHRGRRLDESKPGTGLGLSIVLELAKLYGGTLQLGNSPLGGLRAELVLPAA
jgi:signal transduction histidine kinase